jgi:hypothetical protein
MSFARELAELRQLSGSPEAFAAILPDEWVDALTLAGTPSEVRRRISVRRAVGATSSVLIPVGEDRLGALRELARILDRPMAGAGSVGYDDPPERE